MHSFARRLAGSVVLLWLVLTLTFVLLRSAPGDPAALLVAPGASADEISRTRTSLGLDAPLPVQYARWAGGVLKGDLGTSFARQLPVTQVIGEALPVTLALSGVSLLLTFVMGVTVGAWQARRRGTWKDVVATVATTTVYAAPSFWLALALVALFTVGAARWGFPSWLRLPAFGVRDPRGEPTSIAAVADLARHATLPIVTLTAIGAAGVARYARSVAVDLLRMRWVTVATAKGVPERGVLSRHVLANALPPLLVLLALALPGVLAGSVFVETVFAWPGMGSLLTTAIAARDYPVVLGVTVAYAALVIVANLAADLMLPVVDPRRRS